MPATNALKPILLGTCAFGVGALVAISCVEVQYPTVAFRCSPRQTDNCPEGHFCCSDDPATAGDTLPSYEHNPISGGDDNPIFSGQSNGRGTSGMCVKLDEMPAGSGLMDYGAQGCPVPCNPLWTGDQISQVCGINRRCCQTVEITEKDCVIDPDTGRWRPVTGADISRDLTRWRPGEHDTHQDPNGNGCLEYAGGPGSEGSSKWNSCVNALTVANQRGFCMNIAGSCPTTSAQYLDACEELNGGPSEDGGGGDDGAPTGDDGDDGGATGDGGTGGESGT